MQGIHTSWITIAFYINWYFKSFLDIIENGFPYLFMSLSSKLLSGFEWNIFDVSICLHTELKQLDGNNIGTSLKYQTRNDTRENIICDSWTQNKYKNH